MNRAPILGRYHVEKPRPLMDGWRMAFWLTVGVAMGLAIGYALASCKPVAFRGHVEARAMEETTRL